MKRSHNGTNKYILLAIMLIAVFILPSCRTRITNNSEVSTVQYDEDGYLSEMYEMRREELGLSTAERPILPDFGSADDNNDDFSEGESINYNPDDYQEDFTETPTNTNTNTTTNRSGSQRSSRSRYSSGGRSSNDDNKNIVVLLELNDGKDNVLGSITVEEGGTYEDLPKENPKHPKGYKFLGWFTEKNGGTQVKADTKVTEKSNHSLYAHWDEPKQEEPRKEEFTITIKYNNEGQADKTESVKKGTAYRFPTPEEKKGFTFKGWKVGKETYHAGQEIEISSNITIEAQWAKDTSETEKSSYEVVLDYNDGISQESKVNVMEDGTYEGIPEPESRGVGYTFKGWFDENGKQVKNGDAVKTKITKLTAQWDYDANVFWENEFSEAANVIKADRIKCYIEGSSKAKRDLIKECKGDVDGTTEDNATIVIKFMDDLTSSKAEEEAERIKNAKASPEGEDKLYPNLEKVILIDTTATEGNSSEKILYKMTILEKLYGSGLWVDGNNVTKAQGSKELNVDGAIVIDK